MSVRMVAVLTGVNTVPPPPPYKMLDKTILVPLFSFLDMTNSDDAKGMGALGSTCLHIASIGYSHFVKDHCCKTAPIKLLKLDHLADIMSFWELALDWEVGPDRPRPMSLSTACHHFL